VNFGDSERVLGTGAVKRHDNRHRLPDIPNDIARKRMLHAGHQRRNADQYWDRRRTLPHISKAKSVDDAWCSAYGTQVDLANSRVSVGAAQYRSVQNSR
jgi:hypothetical protein